MALLRIGIITLFSIVFLTSCFDYEDVEFKGVQNIGLEGRSGGNITVRIDMKVKNPNNYNIKIKKSSLDVFVNGSKIGKTKIKNNIVLKKNHQEVYPLFLTLSEKELKGSALSSIGSLLRGSMKVRIKGNIKAKVYGFGKKFPIDVEQPVNLGSIF
jgi:LEA14-like dessication related protein